jgi:uncharacterized protein (TIGR00156 family)
LLAVSGGLVLTTGFFIFIGFDAHIIEGLHEWGGIVFVPACAVHIILNRKPLFNTLNNRAVVITLLVVMLLLAFAVAFSPSHKYRMSASGFTQTFAKDDKKGERQSGEYSGSSRSVVTVEQARSMRNDTKATLRGKIVQHLGGKRYMFQDATGSIEIEISDKRSRRQNIGLNDLVEIYGEVDRERARVKIEAKRITKL